MDFAAIVLVGPGDIEVARMQDLLQSLAHFEPGCAHYVVVDGGGETRSLIDSVPRLPGAVSIIKDPLTGRALPMGANGICMGVLLGLARVFELQTCSFALKLDTDALVIGPFAKAIDAFIRGRAEAGTAGCIGGTCNRNDSRFRAELKEKSSLLNLPSLRSRLDPLGPTPVGVTTEQREALRHISFHVDAAVEHGYFATEYCQGGSYAVSAELTSRMAARGYFESIPYLRYLNLSEDVLMGMYTRAAGMSVCDFSAPGQSFGIQWRGLAYPPEELLSAGYSLIHSVKTDRRYREVELREFFKARRPAS
jgi:hypothetical protein